MLFPAYDRSAAAPITRLGLAPPRSIEIRLCVPGNNQMLRTLNAWLNGVKHHLRHQTERGVGIRNSQVGLVFHFIKFGSTEKNRNIARRHAECVYYLLKGYPQLRRYVVGIDAAGNERLSAPRTFAEAFYWLRKQTDAIRPRSDEPPVRLGGTFHAGEDNDDLLSALRHMHEVVYLLFPRTASGRLGHALLLGDSPETFYSRRGHEVEVQLGGHLLDLVWAHRMLSNSGKSERITWLGS